MSSNLPSGWVECMMGDISTVVGGGTPDASDPLNFSHDAGVAWLTPADLSKYNDTYIARGSRFLTPQGFKGSSAKLMPKGTVLFSSRAPIGYIAIAASEISTNQGFKSFICKIGIHPEYLYFYLKFAKHLAEELASGTTFPEISGKNAARIPVRLAPSNEQERIATKLANVLMKVDVCNKRLERIPTILKRFRQSVLAAACSGRLTTDWREQNEQLESGQEYLLRIKSDRLAAAQSKKEREQIVEAFAGYGGSEENRGEDIELPDSWAWCNVGMVGVVCNGSTPSRKSAAFWGGSIPWVSSGEVRNNVIFHTREEITEEGFESTSVRMLPVGTVLLAMIGEGKTRGQTAILKLSATINQNIAAVVINNGQVLSEYLWHWFQFQYTATREKGSGSGPQALNCQRVRELPFVLPPLAEQTEIVRRVESLFTLADQLEARYNKGKAYVNKLTQSILAKAFRGELVPQDPNDEPAEKLLERVRAEAPTRSKAGRST